MERREFLSCLEAATPLRVASDPASVVVVEEREPAAFRRAFAAAVASGAQVALANPDWGSEERAQFDRLIAQGDVGASSEHGWLLIPTGGSSGGVKLARHDQATLAAAVRGYVDFWNEPVVNGVGVLPLHHVGGLMAWLRCALTGGTYVDASWRAWSEGAWGVEGGLPAADTLSLVPTQVRRLLELEGGLDWLAAFRRVLIGGGAVDVELVEALRRGGVEVGVSYAMTETAALAAVQTGAAAEGFAVLPHLAVTVDEDDRLVLGGASLFRGYWPEWREHGPWASADRGRIDAGGHLHVLGRVDDLINTGGEKVDGREVEALLRSLLGDERVAVLGVPDPRWGQRVVACVAGDLAERMAGLDGVLRERLASYKRPKQIVAVDPWPVNAMGKINRAVLRATAERSS